MVLSASEIKLVPEVAESRTSRNCKLKLNSFDSRVSNIENDQFLCELLELEQVFRFIRMSPTLNQLLLGSIFLFLVRLSEQRSESIEECLVNVFHLLFPVVVSQSLSRLPHSLRFFFQISKMSLK